MKIAVTGSAGFLGSHVVDALLAAGHEVVGIDSLVYGCRENFAHHVGSPRFRFVQEDVRNREPLRVVCEDADVIVHLAALKIPRYGGALDTLLVNADGTRNVLEIAREGRRKVVFASTSDVYGRSPQLPFQEAGDVVLGSSKVARWAYATSKLFDEHLGFATMAEHGVPFVALRFFGSFGPRHHLSWWGGPQSVFMSQILRDEEVTIHGDGRQTRSLTYVEDTVDGIVRATLDPAANGEILNLGATRELTILEIAQMIHALCDTGRPLRLRMVPYESFTGGRYEDVRRRVPDCLKAFETIGWEERIGLEEGLLRTIAWHRAEMIRRGEISDDSAATLDTVPARRRARAGRGAEPAAAARDA